ncbi:MAG: NADH-quinone oxidoreductase subunit N [Thermodesulfovibrio sp.]|uniref:NADH-quinone oxidoreductase subunit N n=1 Tax=unclassified Thermodesulfovibrio TaxID=2645936 RepID=UPI00083A1932|nr:MULTISPECIES: NADH-quinone oxidoreductase subunit N [unclassified Thermodesulfovibrio]MDI1471612.1 NADH-quinone oxidoreductase subunit N [Thermodesulfovibrio sp. 1176]MDI6715147.1 NADH-quinone oxidoreductase subunit N [Thermodesulfovibrio sp.]ODA44727.1 NADH-ubiquinone oxidoreductase chain N [Thermodesulfovibrio sp. N1]
MSQYSILMPEMIMLILSIASFIYGVLRRNDNEIFFIGILTFLLPISLLIFSSSSGEMIGGLIKTDKIVNIFRFLLLMTGFFILLLAYGEIKGRTERFAEFVFLLTISFFGMNLMVLSNDLLLLYLSLETFSLSLYVLAGFFREDRRSVESGMKYFILGTLSSILLLASIAFFYAVTGTTSFDAFKTVEFKNVTVLLSLIFLLASFAFKLSLVPFHAWSPDVYQGAPTSVTALFSTAPKIAVFVALVKIFLSGAENVASSGLIIILSSLSMIVGNILALRQRDLKRMFAYSSIAHAGYIFMAFLLIDEALLRSIIPYLIIYLFMNIGAFAVIMSIKNGENIYSFNGLNKISSLLALSMTVILFSLTGIPPTAGFIVKFNIFKNLFMAGYGGLVFLGLLMSIMSAFYYLRIVFYMYSEQIGNVTLLESNAINRYIAMVSTGVLLITGLFPNLILL